LEESVKGFILTPKFYRFLCENSVKLMDKNTRRVYQPKRVISIVGPSRSGSTIFKYAFCLHPDLSSLAGEEEPYYKIAGNGYPWHDSDEFHQVNNPSLIKLLIELELNNVSNSHNRDILQYFQIEEPPYVKPVICRRTDTLVLKTPQNCYRKGVIEQLYPDAEIIYIQCVRDGRSIVNGLLDGWESEDFKARYTEQGWWKFDMPSNWSWNTTLLERCVNQYKEASKAVVSFQESISHVVEYETFCQDWVACCNPIWNHLGLSKFEPLNSTLPLLSATKEPYLLRWQVDRPWLERVEII